MRCKVAEIPPNYKSDKLCGTQVTPVEFVHRGRPRTICLSSTFRCRMWAFTSFRLDSGCTPARPGPSSILSAGFQILLFLAPGDRIRQFMVHAVPQQEFCPAWCIFNWAGSEKTNSTSWWFRKNSHASCHEPCCSGRQTETVLPGPFPWCFGNRGCRSVW